MNETADPTDLTGRTILQVIPALETGGAERTTLEVAEAIIAAGGRALVVSEGGPMVAELETLGATHITMPVAAKNPLTIIANTGRLRRLIAQEGVNLVHVRSRAPAWSAHAAARRSCVPFVTTYHGIYRARSAVKRQYNAIMARGDVVIANSAFTAEAVREEHMPRPLSDPARLVVIHRGADLRRFSPEAVSADRIAAIAAAWDGPGERADVLKILLPGRLTAWKGQAVLIEAARQFAKTRQTPRLRIVLAGSDQGRTDYAASLAAMVEEHGLQDTVHMPGNCDDMPAALAWADVVVSASTRPEAFGRVAVEAQAMARPVIASAHGGARETVVDGETGRLVPPGDAAALAAAIGDVADMAPAERNSMGAAARDNAVRRFSTTVMTAETLRVYARVLAEYESRRTDRRAGAGLAR